ncbi:MAG: translation elongation factor Ts [candidate division KSB1 bacterium]|nr:translation elongation factor Ts [candidate division KSB1 bacterium]
MGATVTAEDVRTLREKTGAGIMDCKRALAEANGDLDKAVEILRKKGVATAQKKSTREAKEGLIEAYIHPGSRLGVLVEVNCETDFVARTEEFRTLVRNLAMQIAASNPIAVRREDVDPNLVAKELEIYREQARSEGKPEHIIDRIAQGRLDKFYQENVLLEQPYIRDPNITVKQLIDETIAKLGENIVVRRFARFKLGE